jgi:hypothetical protein
MRSGINESVRETIAAFMFFISTVDSQRSVASAYWLA